MDRKTLRAARREDASGAGPTLQDRPPSRFPGASGAFALFGEVLMVGVMVAIASIPVVTLPAALAAGTRHLRRYLHAESSHLGAFWRDVRDALLGGIAIGFGTLALTLILLLDIDLAGTGALPGGQAFAVVGWLGLVALSVTLLTAAGAWSPGLGWRGALRVVPTSVRADIPGALYLASTAGFVVLLTWVLTPLLVPALGIAAMAVVAVPERRRSR